MRARMILAIVSTLLGEAALAVIVLFGLPGWFDIEMPLPGLIALMVAWLAYSVTVYRIGSRALRRKPSGSLLSMVGSQGRVVSTLAPEGLVRVNNELWVARADGGLIQPGREIVVVGQDNLRLTVREIDAADGFVKPG